MSEKPLPDSLDPTLIKKLVLKLSAMFMMKDNGDIVYAYVDGLTVGEIDNELAEILIEFQDTLLAKIK